MCAQKEQEVSADGLGAARVRNERAKDDSLLTRVGRMTVRTQVLGYGSSGTIVFEVR